MTPKDQPSKRAARPRTPKPPPKPPSLLERLRAAAAALAAKLPRHITIPAATVTGLMTRLRLPHAVAALVGAVIAAGVTVAFTVPSGPVVVTIGGSVTKPQPMTLATGKTVTIPAAAANVAVAQKAELAAGEPTAAEAKLKQAPAVATAPATVHADQRVAPPGQPVPPKSIPLASVHEPGCRTLPVRNYSSRAGSPTLLGVLHYTVSPDNGWSGVLGNVSWFNSPAAQASSNYIVSRSGGQCAYIVPEAEKAWAQAGFNSVSLSIEVTATGHESGPYVQGAGRAKVIQIMRDWHRRWGIPYQHGRVSGCTVVRPGFVEHRDLGSCGGGHFDDTPWSIDDLIRAAAGGSTKPASSYLTAGERHNITVLQAERRVAHRHGGWHHGIGPSHLARAVKAKDWLKARAALLRRLGLGHDHRQQRLSLIESAIRR